MAFHIRGGIHPMDNKDATNKKAIEKAKAPEFVSLPVSMHIGAPCEPIVQVGDLVKVGQKIADSKEFISAPIHATISGEIIAIEDRLAPTGAKIPTIVIKNDFEGAVAQDLPKLNYRKMSADKIIEAIREAGIVGHGGAAFPTHVKMKSGLGTVDTVIINAAECEPYITSDHRVLLEQPQNLIDGIKILEKIFGIQNVKIGIETNKKNAFDGLQKVIDESQSNAKIVKLHTKFPQGAEKQLIYAVTKREVPCKKLPADVGCVVFNVDTVVAINTLFTQGLPMIRRIVTVAGSAIANPKNLETPIGTSVAHLIECAGGFLEEPNKLIMGGPMMGVAQFTTDIPVIKGTNAFLAFCKDEDKRAQDPVCIRCGKCVQVCPMGLVPVYMNMYAKKEMHEEFLNIGGGDCIGCGCCSYICPARIDLLQNFKVEKEKYTRLNTK